MTRQPRENEHRLLILEVILISAVTNNPAFTLLAFIFVLSVLIFIHEFGHFMVAKLLLIKVDIFSLGFGPRLAGFKRGGTDYRVSALPLGGYVKMAGDDYENLTGAPNEFLARPKSHRFLVAVAGPFMNLLLAVFLMAVNFNLGIEVPSYFKEPFVVDEIEQNSPAEKAGLQPKDKIVKINDKPTPTLEDAILAIAMSPNQKLNITIEREGTIIEKEIVPRMSSDQGIGAIGASPFVTSIVHSVRSGSPADRAELKKGDEIVSVQSEGKALWSSSKIRELIAKSEGTPLLFTIRRGNEILTKQITPTKLEDRAVIGIAFGPVTVVEKYGLGKSFVQALREGKKGALMQLEFLGKLIRGRASMKAISGPVGIAMFSGEAARAGREVFLGFMAQISLSLGILNLLPIPVLDGGVIFLLLVEGLIRRDLSVAVKERIVQVGVIFLVLLFGVVLVNDISKIPLFSRLFK